MSDDRRLGLYKKYKVERLDGSSEEGRKHEKCDYFILDLVHDDFAKAALLAYASACELEYPTLAQSLRQRVGG